MNKNQHAAINAVCGLFHIVKPKGDPTEQEVRGYYEKVMRADCTCKIERIEHGTVRSVCRKCECEEKLNIAWPFLAEPT